MLSIMGELIIVVLSERGGHKGKERFDFYVFVFRVFFSENVNIYFCGMLSISFNDL